jgi:hypothetical protein
LLKVKASAELIIISSLVSELAADDYCRHFEKKELEPLAAQVFFFPCACYFVIFSHVG